MGIRKICILGGSGFVGAALANHLVTAGYTLRIPTRNREDRRANLILLPDVELVQADILNPARLRELLRGCDAVINLAGILNETGHRGFRAVHVELAHELASACSDAGISRVLHMSALNADAATGPSHYLRSKGEAEDYVHAREDLHVTSFRPSVIFGPGDSFFNRFAALLRLSPLVFPLACADTRFAPVYVHDVCTAMVRTLCDPDFYGARLQLCGPREYTLRELVNYTAACTGIRRLVVGLPDPLARLQAMVLNYSPVERFRFSVDNYLSATVDSVCSCNDLEALSIRPVAIEAIVPSYLSGASARARYQTYRRQSHRTDGT